MPHPIRKAIVRWAAVVVLTPVLYLLSFGPVMAMCQGLDLSPRMVTFLVRVIYRPIYFAADNSSEFRAVMNVYIGLWIW